MTDCKQWTECFTQIRRMAEDEARTLEEALEDPWLLLVPHGSLHLPRTVSDALHSLAKILTDDLVLMLVHSLPEYAIEEQGPTARALHRVREAMVEGFRTSGLFEHLRDLIALSPRPRPELEAELTAAGESFDLFLDRLHAIGARCASLLDRNPAFPFRKGPRVEPEPSQGASDDVSEAAREDEQPQEVL